MTIDEFIDTVSVAFPVSAGSLTPDTRYKDLSDWNSMCALVLITTIGEVYDVSLSPDDALEAETLGDLYQIVQNKLSIS